MSFLLTNSSVNQENSFISSTLIFSLNYAAVGVKWYLQWKVCRGENQKVAFKKKNMQYKYFMYIFPLKLRRINYCIFYIDLPCSR